MSTPDPNKQEEEKKESSFEKWKKNEKVDQVVQYASRNSRDTLAYILLLTGILLLNYEPFFAGALIGVIVGLYFAPEIVDLAKNTQSWITRLGVPRAIVFGGLLIAFFIMNPFIFLGAIVAVAVRQLIE